MDIFDRENHDSSTLEINIQILFHQQNNEKNNFHFARLTMDSGPDYLLNVKREKPEHFTVAMEFIKTKGL